MVSLTNIAKITAKTLEKELPDVAEEVVSKASASAWDPGIAKAVVRTGGIPATEQARNVSAIRRTTGDEAKLQSLVKEGGFKETPELKTWLDQEQKANGGLGRWSSEDDITLMPVSPETKVSHEVYKAIADLDHIVQNDKILRNMEREGFVGSDTGLVVKEADTNIVKTDSYSNMEIRVDGSHKRLNSTNISAKDLQDKYIDNGYHLYEVHPYSQANDDLNYNFILSRDTEKYSKQLPANVLHYAEGGPRMYQTGEYFVKSGYEIFGEGRSYFGSRTLVSGDDLTKVKKYAEEVNRAVEIFNEAEGYLPRIQELLDKENFEQFKVTTATDLYNAIRTNKNPDGYIDPHFKAGVYRSGERPLSQNNLPEFYSSSGMDSARYELSKLSSRYYNKRGKIINNINSDNSNLASPHEIMNKLIRRISYNRNMVPLLESHGEYFKNNFGDLVDLEKIGGSIEGKSGTYLVTQAPLKDSNTIAAKDKARLRAAEHMQHVVRTISNVPNDMDAKIIRGWNNALDSVGVNLGRWWDMQWLDKMKDINPLRTVQGVAFHTYLGFLNLSQLWKQPLQISNILALSPSSTPLAILRAPWVLTALVVKRENNKGLLKAIKTINKRMANVTGMSNEELDLAVKFFEQYGTLRQTGNRPELQGTNTFLNSLTGLKKLTTLPFETGNTITQIVADLTAFRDVANKTDFKAIAALSDKYMFHMTKANMSPVQSNPITALITQFGTYQMGVIGALVGKDFNKTQRTVLGAALIGMYGVAGLVGYEFGPNIFTGLKQYVEDGTAKLWTYGKLTKMFEDHGYNLREGPGIIQPFKTAWDVAASIIDSKHELPSLPASGSLPMIAGMYQLVKDFISPDTDERNALGWLRMVQHSGLPTGVRNFTKAFYGFATGKYLDKYGQVIKDNVDGMDTIMTALGFRPIEEIRLSDSKAYAKYYMETVDDCIDTYIKPLADALVDYQNTKQWDATSITGYQEIYNTLLNNTANCRKMIQDNMPKEFDTYFSNKLEAFYNPNKGTAVENLSKYQRAIYNNLIGVE